VIAHAEVTIRCKQHCEFGQVLKVVGAPAEFGAWDVAAAPTLKWSEGDLWSVKLQLPEATALSFKVRWGGRLSAASPHASAHCPTPCACSW